MVVPDGYALSDRFAGFSDPQGASLLVTEWPDAERAVAERIDRVELEERGMTLVEENELAIDGRPRRLLHVTQYSPGGVQLQRRILIVGDEESTSVLAATAPQSEFPPELGETLRSMRRDGALEIAPFEGLGFELDEGRTLEVSERVADVVHMAPRGMTGPPGPRDAQLIAGRADSPDYAQLAELASDRLALTPGVRSVEILSDRGLELGGLPAHELVARAEDVESHDRITLLQTIAVDGDLYYLVQGRVASAHADEYLPEFRRIAASFRLTD